MPFSPDCGVVVREQAEAHLDRISSALRANYLAILTGLLIAVVALYLTSLVASVAITSIQRYYALLPTPKAAKKAGNGGDDMVYADEREATNAASNLQDSDNDRIRARLHKLKATYAAYNKASAENSINQPGMDANLMDEQILSRANDDYLPPVVRDGGGGVDQF